MELPYTAAFVGAVLLILQQSLMMSTGVHRGKVRIGVGVGDDKDLERKARRHGNLAENAAIFLVMLAIAEGMFGPSIVATIIGVGFLVARLSHAAAFSSLAGSHGQDGAPKVYAGFRVVGALLTAVSGIALGLYLLVNLLV